MLQNNDKFINLIFKESKKSRFEGTKLKNDLGNFGGELGSKYFVDRNGEYTGIIIQLEEKMFPLFLTNSVHQIYLNIESGYTNNMLIVEKFNLIKLYQKYSNQLFRYIVDEFLLSNNLEPIYLDYLELEKNKLLDKELIGLKNKIGLDYHQLIPIPIKLISCGSLLPESWTGQIFDSGKNFHLAIDKLDERIGKPPVTYLANYCMCLLKIPKPELYQNELVKKYIKIHIENNPNNLIFILDKENLKFIKYINKNYNDCGIKYLEQNTLHHSFLNIELKESNINIMVIFSPELIMCDKIESKQLSIGFNASLLQKSIRRGSGSLKCLIESINNLTSAIPFNNPEYSYQMVSGIRQLCWRSFITIIEETKCYTSLKYLDLLDFSLYSYIFSIYPNYYCTSILKNKIQETCTHIQQFEEYWNFTTWKDKNNNKNDKDKDKNENLEQIDSLRIGIEIGFEKMPGMKGDKIMLKSTINWLKTYPELSSLDLTEKNNQQNNQQNNNQNELQEKITWLNSLDHHCNPGLIANVHNGLYGIESKLVNYNKNLIKQNKITIKDTSSIIWKLNSKYNFRKHIQKWSWVNDLIIFIQFLTNKNKSKIFDFSLKNQNLKNYLINFNSNKFEINNSKIINFEAEQNLELNLQELEFQSLMWNYNFEKLSHKLIPVKLNYNIPLYRIGQIILSNQILNAFWYKGKKTIPIYTNEQIKFKIGDNIYDFDSDSNSDSNSDSDSDKSKNIETLQKKIIKNDISFVQILKYFLLNYKIKIKLNSKILKNKEFDIIAKDNKILINGIECVLFTKDNKLIWTDKLNLFIFQEEIYKTKIDSDSNFFVKLKNIVSESNQNPVNNYILYKSLELLDIKLITSNKNYIFESEIFKYISLEILKILVGRIGTSIEDKNDQIILILGKVDRLGKSTTDAIDDFNEGYLIRIINIMSKLYSCFEKVNETKFIVHVHSKIYKYWIEQINNLNSKLDETEHKVEEIDTNKKVFRAISSKNISNDEDCNGNTKKINSFIKTELWSHQKKVKNMILNGIEKYNQKGYGDASNVGSGKTLTGLSVIDGINNIIMGKKNNCISETNYLILVPNTNLYSVWVNEIKSHCNIVRLNYYIQNSNGEWNDNSSNRINKNINIFITTMGRGRDHPLNRQIEFVIIDECLTVQNNQSKWTIKAFEQVVKSTYGVLMLSATFFRTRFDKLFFMLKMLQIELPTKIDYLDTILNIAIGANIKTMNKYWQTTFHKIELDNEFYKGYDKSKKSNKKDSYIELKKYMHNNVNWGEIFVDKVNNLIKLNKKPVVFVESETQLEKLEKILEQKKIRNLWSFYPDISQDICVISKHKGTYGINNLVKYNTLVLKPPEPDKLPQIKGRLDRPGQNSSKLFIEYISIANTIDEIDLVSLEIANNFYSSHIIPLANYYDKYA